MPTIFPLFEPLQTKSDAGWRPWERAFEEDGIIVSKPSKGGVCHVPRFNATQLARTATVNAPRKEDDPDNDSDGAEDNNNNNLPLDEEEVAVDDKREEALVPEMQRLQTKHTTKPERATPRAIKELLEKFENS